eukprot:Platyproteum_vivax@DN10113_c0_g1_i1.p1
MDVELMNINSKLTSTKGLWRKSIRLPAPGMSESWRKATVDMVAGPDKDLIAIRIMMLDEVYIGEGSKEESDCITKWKQLLDAATHSVFKATYNNLCGKPVMKDLSQNHPNMFQKLKIWADHLERSLTDEYGMKREIDSYVTNIYGKIPQQRAQQNSNTNLLQLLSDLHFLCGYQRWAADASARYINATTHKMESPTPIRQRLQNKRSRSNFINRPTQRKYDKFEDDRTKRFKFPKASDRRNAR